MKIINTIIFKLFKKLILILTLSSLMLLARSAYCGIIVNNVENNIIDCAYDYAVIDDQGLCTMLKGMVIFTGSGFENPISIQIRPTGTSEWLGKLNYANANNKTLMFAEYNSQILSYQAKDDIFKQWAQHFDLKINNGNGDILVLEDSIQTKDCKPIMSDFDKGSIFIDAMNDNTYPPKPPVIKNENPISSYTSAVSLYKTLLKFNNRCLVSKKSINVLVGVNTDEYKNVPKSGVKKIFDIANQFWMVPKLGVKFDVKDVLEVQAGLNGQKIVLLENAATNYVQLNKGIDYIVLFGGDFKIYGGFQKTYTINGYYNAMPMPGEDKSVIAVADIDLFHLWGRCGYNKTGSKIIFGCSSGGECADKNGLMCVEDNGYQMCPDVAETFMVQSPLNMQALAVVHELLHSYGGEHYGSPCIEQIGQVEFDKYNNQPVMLPFDDKEYEYATICPNAWKNLKNSMEHNVCLKLIKY